MSLPGLAQATDLDLVVLALKLIASGVSLGLLLIVAMGAATMGARGRLSATYLSFACANLLAALYVSADTCVRLGVLVGDLPATLLMVRLATGTVVLAMAAYICLYWVLDAAERPPWPRVGALYGLAVLAAALLWVEHPALVIASDALRVRGLSAFADYGAGALWFYGLQLVLLAALGAGLLRSSLRRRDLIGWRLNLLGLSLLLLAGGHDALRELGVVLLPFPTLWLGFVCFQLGAFGLLTLHYVRLLRENRQQSLSLQRLSDAVVRDRATGLYSRPYLQQWLEAGGAASGGLLFIDLDNFKAINDRYGHLRGDAVIGAVAELLLTGIRAGDLACRWGGDEFVVYLARGGAEPVRALAERLRRRAQALRIDGAPELRVSLSMGYAPLTPDWRRSAEAADRALYAAKRAGRDRLVLAEEAEETAA